MPLLLNGRLIFTTLIPSGGACDAGGTSFVMVVSPTTGASIDSAVLDVTGDGKLTSCGRSAVRVLCERTAVRRGHHADAYGHPGP